MRTQALPGGVTKVTVEGKLDHEPGQVPRLHITIRTHHLYRTACCPYRVFTARFRVHCPSPVLLADVPHNLAVAVSPVLHFLWCTCTETLSACNEVYAGYYSERRNPRRYARTRAQEHSDMHQQAGDAKADKFTFHIKNMGPGTFTNDLNVLAPAYDRVEKDQKLVGSRQLAVVGV